MDQYEQIQSYNKKFFRGIAIKFLLAAIVFFGVTAFVGLIWYYRDLDERKIGFEEAKKIGNWELPDDYYVFQGAFKLYMFDDTAKNVEILDKKNGNEINILAMSKGFSDAHLKFDSNMKEGEKSNDELFMEYYAEDNYAIRAVGKIEDGNAEVHYSLIENKEYENLGDKILGFLGKANCRNEVIVILIRNKADKFDAERAFDFAKTFKCENSSLAENSEEKSGGVFSGGDKNASSRPVSGESGNASSTNSSFEDNYDTPKADREAESSENSGIKYLPQEAERSAESDFMAEDNDKDGLSNNVEYVAGSDPNRPDTDSDGFSDFDEIKYGFNPQVPSPGDELPPDCHERLKEQIKIIDEENFNKIFN